MMFLKNIYLSIPFPDLSLRILFTAEDLFQDFVLQQRFLRYFFLQNISAISICHSKGFLKASKSGRTYESSADIKRLPTFRISSMERRNQKDLLRKKGMIFWDLFPQQIFLISSFNRRDSKGLFSNIHLLERL